MRMVQMMAMAVMVCALAGCSGKSPDQGEHVWKEQTDTIKKAQQVDDVLKQSADQQRAQMERDSQ